MQFQAHCSIHEYGQSNVTNTQWCQLVVICECAACSMQASDESAVMCAAMCVQCAACLCVRAVCAIWGLCTFRAQERPVHGVFHVRAEGLTE